MQYQPFVAANQTNKQEESAPEETLELLEKYKVEFTKQISNGTSRKNRIEALMIRRSAGKWTPEKRQKMIRRHQAALAQIETATRILDQINARIEQVSNREGAKALS